MNLTNRTEPFLPLTNQMEPFYVILTFIKINSCSEIEMMY